MLWGKPSASNVRSKTCAVAERHRNARQQAMLVRVTRKIRFSQRTLRATARPLLGLPQRVKRFRG